MINYPVLTIICILCTKGAIDVSVATMTREERLQTGEAYTVGFVPSYDLPDKRPNSIDPFLEPLVSDIENGFIEGKKLKFRCKYLLLVTVSLKLTFLELYNNIISVFCKYLVKMLKKGIRQDLLRLSTHRMGSVTSRMRAKN